MNYSSKDITPSYTQESHFEQVINAQAAELWQNRQEGFIKSHDKTRLFWAALTSENHDKAIVVVNGRIECCWKYQELFYDLFQQGYDVYSFDHRGQGLSDRLIEPEQMGHVSEFDDYIHDMHAVLESFPLARYQKRYLLAHSMGGTIATRYVQHYPTHGFSALSLSAPMYGINMPSHLRPIALPLAVVLTNISSQPTYAPGHQAYFPKPFENNPLSQSEVRYRWFRALYEAKPQLKIGGPSTRWVWQGILAAKQCILHTRQINLPLLVLQASEDTIVSNPAQIKFIKKLANSNTQCGFKIIHGAKHEILFERDEYRNQALDAILYFFSQH